MMVPLGVIHLVANHHYPCNDVSHQCLKCMFVNLNIFYLCYITHLEVTLPSLKKNSNKNFGAPWALCNLWMAHNLLPIQIIALIALH